jgi:hypothetical protein
LEATSWMRARRPSVHMWAASDMNGGSSLTIDGHPGALLNTLQCLLPSTGTDTSGAHGALTVFCPLTSGHTGAYPLGSVGTQLWLRGDSLVNTSSGLTWRDLSHNAALATGTSTGTPGAGQATHPTFNPSSSNAHGRPTVVVAGFGTVSGGSFPSGGQYLTVPNSVPLEITGALTIAVTVYISDPTLYHSIANKDPGAQGGVGDGPCEFVWRLSTFNEITNVTGLSTNYVWSDSTRITAPGVYTLIWTTDATSNQQVYVNGSPASLFTSHPHAGSTSGSPLLIGRQQNTNQLVGEIVEYIILSTYSTPLQAAALTSYMQDYLDDIGPANNSVIVGGDPEVTYELTFNVLGVVEQKTYTGGTINEQVIVYPGLNNTFFRQGGYPATNNFAIYSLTVSDPPATYYFNSGQSGAGVGGNPTVYPIDYNVTIPVQGGATVTLLGNSVDLVEVANQTDGLGGDPISLPGTNIPQPYNGQWIQLSLVSQTHIPQAIQAMATLDGTSNFSAHCEQKWQVSAALYGDSTVQVYRPDKHLLASANLQGDSMFPQPPGASLPYISEGLRTGVFVLGEAPDN